MIAPQITYPAYLLGEDARRLRRDRLPHLDRPAGRSRAGSETEEIIAARIKAPEGFVIRLGLRSDFFSALSGDLPAAVIGVLELGGGPLLGSARGWIRDHSGAPWRPAARLFIPGPGCAVIAMDDGSSSASDGGSRTTGPVSPAAPLTKTEMERSSRTIAALGADTFHAISALRFGFLGMGRLGCALLSAALAYRFRRLTIVDPDRVEPHNLGEGGFFDETMIGLPKVHAWENALALRRPEIAVTAVAESLTHRAAMDALLQSDVIFCAPDHPMPRFLCAALGAAYSRLIIDTGSEVHADGGPALMGFDIRLIAPERCGLCFGGAFAAETEAGIRRLIASPNAEARTEAARDWRSERPRGSLHSLNLCAAAHAMRLFEDFMHRDASRAGRFPGSVWLRMEWDAAGQMSSRTIEPPAPRWDHAPCACALAGWAGAAPAQIVPLLDRRLRHALDAASHG